MKNINIAFVSISDTFTHKYIMTFILDSNTYFLEKKIMIRVLGCDKFNEDIDFEVLGVPKKLTLSKNLH